MLIVASSSLLPLLVLSVEAVGLGGWLLIRYGYPAWFARRQRQVLVRAAQQELVDPDFSDHELLAACRDELAAIGGVRPIGKIRELDPLLPGAGDWASMHTNHYGAESRVDVDPAGCDVVRVLSRGQAGPARTVVRVAVRLKIHEGIVPRSHQAEAFWTMTKLAAGWTRTAVEGKWEGRRHLDHDPLRSPDADIGFLHDTSVLETAHSSPASPQLISEAGDVIGRQRARAAALDLSQIDSRYSPDVIQASMRMLLAAWEAATDGQAHALDQLADPHAIGQLLRPERGLPPLIREPHIRHLDFAEVDATATPPSISVICSVKADPNISHLDLCWRLSLSQDSQRPWHLSDAMAWKDAYFYARD